MRLRWKKGYLFGSLLIFDIYTNLEILPEMIISAMPDPIIIHCKGRISWIYRCAESACPVFWKSPVRKEEIMVSDR